MARDWLAGTLPALFLGAWLAGCAPSHDGQRQLEPPEPPAPLQLLRVSPRLQYGPRASFHLVIRVPRNIPDNRELCVMIPAARLSCWDLNEHSPEVFEYWVYDLVVIPGEWEVEVHLLRRFPLSPIVVRQGVQVLMA